MFLGGTSGLSREGAAAPAKGVGFSFFLVHTVEGAEFFEEDEAVDAMLVAIAPGDANGVFTYRCKLVDLHGFVARRFPKLNRSMVPLAFGTRAVSTEHPVVNDRGC